MVNISSSRRRGTSAQTRYRIRRIILLAIIAIIIFYIFSLRLYLKKQQQQQQQHTETNDNKNSYGPPQREENDDDNNNKPVAVIAHAISLIKCSKGSSVTGFLDAAAILRHSIHKNSIHYKPPILIGNNNNSTTTSTAPKHQQRRRRSKYSYKMYGIVHTSCADHAQVLERLGYEIMVRDHPIKKDDIKGEWLRNHIEAENCCGSAEFIKLYGMFHLIYHSNMCCFFVCMYW